VNRATARIACYSAGGTAQESCGLAFARAGGTLDCRGARSGRRPPGQCPGIARPSGRLAVMDSSSTGCVEARLARRGCRALHRCPAAHRGTQCRWSRQPGPGSLREQIMRLLATPLKLSRHWIVRATACRWAPTRATAPSGQLHMAAPQTNLKRASAPTVTRQTLSLSAFGVGSLLQAPDPHHACGGWRRRSSNLLDFENRADRERSAIAPSHRSHPRPTEFPHPLEREPASGLRNHKDCQS